MGGKPHSEIKVQVFEFYVMPFRFGFIQWKTSHRIDMIKGNNAYIKDLVLKL